MDLVGDDMLTGFYIYKSIWVIKSIALSKNCIKLPISEHYITLFCRCIITKWKNKILKFINMNILFYFFLLSDQRFKEETNKRIEI